MSQAQRQALDLVKANESGANRIAAARRVMLASPSELEFIIHAYSV